MYCIHNTVNDKVYVGSSCDMRKRMYVHNYALSKGNHKNKHLQNAWDKYGCDAFECFVLEHCSNDALLEREQFWMEKFSVLAREHGYNECSVAGNTLGHRHSDETKLLLSEIAKGRRASGDTKRKMSLSRTGELNGMFGKHHTEESKEKMRYLKDGRLRSEAQKGINNPFYGKKHSEESLRKMRESKIGTKGRAKLCKEQVVEIRNSFDNKPSDMLIKDWTSKMCEQYGVGRSCIRKIINRERWKDV